MPDQPEHGEVARAMDGFFAVPAGEQRELKADFDGVIASDFDGRLYVLPGEVLDRYRIEDDDVEAAL